ncbi:nucleotide-diphospho-sugar transferase [Zopfochytrium polystomum]|nr:nucleotide-diphospho-sugar transferase [Zopfochytrium polystomum]
MHPLHALEGLLWAGLLVAAWSVWRDASTLHRSALLPFNYEVRRGEHQDAVEQYISTLREPSTDPSDSSALTASPSSPAQASPHAYASLCIGDGIVDGILVLFHSLQKANATADFVAMVHNVSASHLARLHAKRIRTYPVDPLRFHSPYMAEKPASTRARDAILWTKLRVWLLADYAKVVLLDADLFVLRNVDDLFRLPELAGCPAVDPAEKIMFFRDAAYGLKPGNKIDRAANAPPHDPRTGLVVGWSGLNSGVTVVEPSRRTFASLVNELSILPNRPCCPSQEFLYNYFEERGRFHRIASVYNSRLANEDPEGPTKVHHFVGAKPWKKKDEHSWLHRLWWQYRDEVHSQLKELTEGAENGRKGKK